MSKFDENERSIQDEAVRRNIQVISARLYDLRERFMKVIQNINRDAASFDQDETNDVDDEMSVDQNENENELSDAEENDEPFVFSSPTEQKLIEEIIERKARQHVHLQHLSEYPKILRYLVENDRKSSCLIPLRHVEPFIIAHVSQNPSGKIYDKIIGQIEDIRRNYLQIQHDN